MLDEMELIQVRDYITDVLPETLRQDPKFVTAIEEIVAQHFPRRDEFGRLLDQLTAHTQRFDQVDERFDQVDEHLAQIYERFYQVDERFRRVDARFDQVDERFRRVDARFDQVERRLEAHRVETNKRFDEHGNRLDKLDRNVLHVRRDVVKLNSSVERIIRRSEQQEKWLNLATGQLGDEKGQRLEDMVAVALRYGLENPEITPESLSLRQKVVDTEGLVFKRGFETEVDLIALENKLTVFKVFEVKATAKAGDVDIFALKVELIAHQNPGKEVQGILISLGAHQEVRQRCAKYGLELLP